MGYFWGWGRVQKLFWVPLIETNDFFSKFCSISAPSCSFAAVKKFFFQTDRPKDLGIEAQSPELKEVKIIV